MKITDKTRTNTSALVPQRGDIIKRESMYGTSYYIVAKAHSSSGNVLIDVATGGNYSNVPIPVDYTLAYYANVVFTTGCKDLTLVRADLVELVIGG